MKNKQLIGAGLLCLAINAISVYFFINRDSFGNFTRLVSYDELYSPEYNTNADRKKWDQAMNQFPADQLQEGKQLTMTSAGVKQNDSTLTKIIKIGSWLRRSFSKCKIGKPTDSFEKLSSIEQYNSASRAESPVWCGTFGSQLLFFCYANGITSRYIETKGIADNHVINELFVPELNCWVFSDLLNNVIYCKDHTGKLLNSVDLVYRNSKNDTSAFTAFQQHGNDSLQIVPRKEYTKLWATHLNAGNKLHFYYTTDLTRVYTMGQKTTRYLYPKTWFAIFTLLPVSNTAFYLRLMFLYSGIVLFFIFVFLYLKNK